MGIPHFIGLSLLAYAASTHAANCYSDKPIQPGGPSGDDYAAAIKAQPASICAGGNPSFPRIGADLSTNANDNTWNYGFVNFRIRRTKANTDLSNCNEAFDNIINQCIKGSKVWGGEWILGEATYTIENAAYPQNPLTALAVNVPGLVATSSSAITTYTQDPANSNKAESAAALVAAALLLATAVGSPASLIASLQIASIAATAAVSTPGPAAAAALATAWEAVKPADPKNGDQPTSKPEAATTTSSSTPQSTEVTFPIVIKNCGQIQQTNLPPGAITSDSSVPRPTVEPNSPATTPTPPPPPPPATTPPPGTLIFRDTESLRPEDRELHAV